MNKKRMLGVVLACAMVLLRTGCKQQMDEAIQATKQKTVVTMMYTTTLDNFEALVESTYADIDLQVEVNAASTINGESQRRLRNGHGTDLITTTLPTGEVKDYTIDLSAKSFADSYQVTAIKSVLLNGELHYVPLPGGYSGYILNETLARQLTDTLPTTNEELLDLMELAAARNVGVNDDGTLFGLVADDVAASGKFFYAMQVPDFLSKVEGMQWRADYGESNATFSGTEAWEHCLDWFKQLVDRGYFNPKSYQMYVTNAMPVEERMEDGTMLLCYGNMKLLSTLNGVDNGNTYTMLPYLSSEGNAPWVTSSPDGYLAVNNALEADGADNADKLDACLRVLELLSTNEGQTAWIADTAAESSYLMGYENEEDELPEAVRACVDNGYVYHIQLPPDVIYAFGDAMVSVLNGKQTIQEALAEVDDYRQNGSQETEYEQTLVGSLAQDLLCKNYDVRLEETALGDLVADAVAEYAGTELAVVNGGGIRGSLYAGDVYGADLEAVCPYGNHIVVLEVTGAVIRAMVENGISLTERENVPGGRFLQVSGLRYSYTPATDDASAQLLSLTLADGTALEDSQTYRIAVNNYMAGSSGYLENNGDGYTMLNVYSDDVPKAEGVRLIQDTEATYADALRKYFSNHQADTITAGIEGRITVVTEG